MITRLEVRVHIACGPALCAATTFGERSVGPQVEQALRSALPEDGAQGLERAAPWPAVNAHGDLAACTGKDALVLATRDQCG
jgi:hypothetical protein